MRKISFVFFCSFLMVLLFASQAQGAGLLQLGSRGSEVKAVQQRLKDLGFLNGPVDGIFGSQTKSAVVGFQKSKGLRADGIVGPATSTRLWGNSTSTSYSTSSRGIGLLQLGSRGSEVKAVQQRLKDLGFLNGSVDGIFGSQTRSAVIAFQRSKGLQADGIVGPATSARLWSSSTSGNTSTTFTRLLKVGCRGNDVKQLQLDLKKLGFFKVDATGYFGTITRSAVMNFQKSKGLAADGIAGAKTIASLKASLGAVPPANNGTPAPTNPVVSTWKPAKGKINMTWDNNPASLALTAQGVDAVAPVWFTIDKQNNQIVVLTGRASKTYVDTAHQRGYKVFGTVQSFTPAYSQEIVTKPEVANSVISSISNAVSTYGLDGINIDFENMIPQDKDLFTAFVKQLTNELRKKNQVVTIDVTEPPDSASSSSYWSACYDRKALAQIVDYVAVMAYDEFWVSSPINGPVASIDWVNRVIQKTLVEVPKEKLLLGVPFYTYDWISKPSPDNPDVYVRQSQAPALGMNQINSIIRDSQYITGGKTVTVAEWITKPVWLDSEGVTYMKFKDGENNIHEIWAEDNNALARKLNLVDQYGLAGVSSWQLVFANQDAWTQISQKMNK